MNGGNECTPGGKAPLLRTGDLSIAYSATIGESFRPGTAVSCPHLVRRPPGIKRQFAACCVVECAFCSDCSSGSMCGPHSLSMRCSSEMAKDTKPLRKGWRLGSAPHVSGTNLGAGWSGPIARQAHNLIAEGSNPAPATNPSFGSVEQPGQDHALVPATANSS